MSFFKDRKVEEEDTNLSGLLGDKGLPSDEYDPNSVANKRVPKKTWLTLGVAGLVFGTAALGAGSVVMAPALAIAAPSVEGYKNLPESLPDATIAQRSVMYDINGEPFAEIYSQDRVVLDSLDKVSDNVKNALISTEDKRFYEHSGFDPVGTARAAISGSGGGSGITQQLIKNYQFYDMAGKNKEKAIEATLSRKIQELKFSLDYEKNHSKDEILLNYLNLVSFGSPSTYSIEGASKYFFGKSAKDLDVAEAAVLVGSVQNPVSLNLNKVNKDVFNEYSKIYVEKSSQQARMYLDKEIEKGNIDESQKKTTIKIKERQNEVLLRMADEGHIDKDKVEEFYATPLNLVYKKSSTGNCTSSKYESYCERVLKELSNSPRLGETEEERAIVIDKGGLHIRTYLDPKVQDKVTNRLESDFGYENRVVAPTAIVQPGTGGIIAADVNREYGDGEGKTTIDVPSVRTGTGSAYKMFTLAAALENGMSPQQLEFSTPCPLYFSDFDEPSGGFSNSLGCSKLQSQNLNFEEATAYSSNTWFTFLAEKIAYPNGEFVGLEPVFKMTDSLGLHTPDNITNRSMSYVLGATGNSTIDMAAAYAAFANEGVYCPPTSVKSYEYSDGTSPVVPESYNPEDTSCRAAMSPGTASTVLRAMRANTVPGHVDNAFGLMGNIPGYDAVGKSGTNQNYNYTWGQVSKNYSLFINITDMDKMTRGVNGNFWFRGGRAGTSTAVIAGSSVMKDVLKGTTPVPLDFNNNSTDRVNVPVERKDFFTVPSVVGMSPEQALDTLRSTGVKTNISKEKIASQNGLPSGVIGEQSIPAGEKLAVGTQKEIVLKMVN